MLSGTKYVYITVLFMLMAGFFHPLITEQPGDSVVYGTLVLFVGLAGAIPLHRAARNERGRLLYMGIGLGLVALSLTFIFLLTNRL